MRRILLPLEQTERSLKALQYFRKHYSPNEAAVVLLMIDESLGYSVKQEEEDAAIQILEQKFALIKDFLKGYEVYTKAEIGRAGPRICKCAREYGVSLIAMTKSSKEDMLNQIGRTTEYVLINAPCNVCIVSETRDSSEYRGLVYTKAHSVVNLRGQIGDKQSECLLPSVTADCNYHIEVSVGKVRFYHTAFNPDTGNWDLPPAGNQEASVDIAAGEKADIFVRLGRTDGKSDRIRVVNRGMKQEAVFNYLITPDEGEKQEQEIENGFVEPVSEIKESDIPSIEEPVSEYEAPEQFEQNDTKFEWVAVAAVAEDINPDNKFPLEEIRKSTVSFEMPTVVEDINVVEADVSQEQTVDRIDRYVDTFRSAWDTQVYFDDICAATTETDIFDEYMRDWKLCAEDNVDVNAPDAATEEMGLSLKWD